MIDSLYGKFNPFGQGNDFQCKVCANWASMSEPHKVDCPVPEIEAELERTRNLSVALESELARNGEWHVFEPGNLDTYPPNDAQYWATWKNGRVERQHFDVDSPFVDVLWRHCTHWREVVEPISPNAEVPT